MRSTFLRTGMLALLSSGALACGGGDGKSAAVTDPKSPGDTTTVIPDSAGQLLTASFTSSALGTSKSYRIYLPPTYSKSSNRRYPVVYFLHGFGGTERYWTDSLQLHRTADSIAKAGGVEMILVMPDGDNSAYHTWVNPPSEESCRERGSIGSESVDTYCVPHMRYDTYIAQDLVAHIDATYRTLTDKAHRGIAGYSLGGGGAIYLTLAYPSVFGAAASLSGGIFTPLNVGPSNNPVNATDTLQLRNYWDFMWVDFAMAQQYGPNLNDWRTYDPVTMVQSRPAASVAPMWFVVGSDEHVLVRTTNEVFRDVLIQRGVAHEYAEIPGGEHTFTFWRSQQRAALVWLGEKLKP